MSMLTVVVVSVLVLVQRAAATCPDSSWTAGPEEATCYRVSQSGLTFDGGLEWCGQQGGYLAEIMTAQEEMLLDTFLIEGTSYWLGLTDLAHEGLS